MKFNFADWLDLSFVDLKVGTITTEYMKFNFENIERTGKASKDNDLVLNEFYFRSSNYLCYTRKVEKFFFQSALLTHAGHTILYW